MPRVHRSITSRCRLGPVLMLFGLMVVACGSAGVGPDGDAGPDSGGDPAASQGAGPAPPPPSSQPSSADVSSVSSTSVSPSPEPPVGGTTLVEPAPDGLTPIVPGHNDLDGDRINLVFAPWGWDDHETFRQIVVAYLGWDGAAQRFDQRGWPTSDPEAAVSADLGLFGFEPFRSHRDVFNIWLAEAGPEDFGDFVHSDEPDPYDLPDLAVVTLAFANGADSFAEFSPAFGIGPVAQRSGDHSMGNAVVSLSDGRPDQAIRTLAHELGHALFGFADEYVGRKPGEITERNDFWPSCPASVGTAEAWWGDLIGQYDPMIDVYLDEMEAAGFPHPDPDGLRDVNRTAIVEDGCFGVPGSARSTEDSLMGFETPAFGLTNRREAERILGLWPA